MLKISKQKATELIKKSSGKFITVKNIKLNGDEREYKSSNTNELLFILTVALLPITTIEIK